MLLQGVIVGLAGADGPFAEELARGLVDHGAHLTPLDGNLPLDGVVHCCTDADALAPASFESLDPHAWDVRCEAVLRAAIDTCRIAHARMSARGGAVVFVTPAVSLVGAAGYAASTAGLEGVRSLVKSAARQWGSVGITVACVAPGLDLVVPDAPAPVERAALARSPEVRTEVAGAVAFLLSGAARGVTGATIVVDGGSVMSP